MKGYKKMDLNSLTDMIMRQGVFAALFIWLLIDTNKKNEIREQRMQEQLDKTIPILNQIVLRLDDIENKIK
ncbi:BhlA/UviB family holin-like peptide [Romboutsia sp.]|uniref:BhlA/UviB family holin-like peptide n=1 Tax=Romboutsia sp. TaxID=1965302 RepID=UPI003F669119